MREASPLRVPLIISLGTPFLIALGRDPDPADRQPSFASGLSIGPVHIESDGGAECVQVDFTPLGAYRFFGGAVVDLAARMVDIGDVLGSEGRLLHQRLGEMRCWQRRFDLLEEFVVSRASHLPSPEIAFAYRRLALIKRWRKDHDPRQRDRLEPQASGRPLSVRAWPRPEIRRAHDTLPSGLPAGTNGAVARLGRHRRGERLCRSGPSRPRICRSGRRVADRLGPASGADQRPAHATGRRAGGLVTNLQATWRPARWATNPKEFP